MNVCQIFLFFVQITPKITCFPCKFTYCWAQITFFPQNLTAPTKMIVWKGKVAGAGRRMDYVFIYLRYIDKFFAIIFVLTLSRASLTTHYYPAQRNWEDVGGLLLRTWRIKSYFMFMILQKNNQGFDIIA